MALTVYLPDHTVARTAEDDNGCGPFQRPGLFRRFCAYILA
jgi:hypothetical protein